MYLTAHLVHNEEGEGINAFLHVHGSRFRWPDAPERLPDENPGRIVEKRTDLRPGGNNVRAYLDVLAPDGTHKGDVQEAIHAFQRDLPERRNPTVFNHNKVTIRFGVEIGLEKLRQDQLLLLSNAALRLLK